MIDTINKLQSDCKSYQGQIKRLENIQIKQDKELVRFSDKYQIEQKKSQGLDRDKQELL